MKNYTVKTTCRGHLETGVGFVPDSVETYHICNAVGEEIAACKTPEYASLVLAALRSMDAFALAPLLIPAAQDVLDSGRMATVDSE